MLDVDDDLVLDGPALPGIERERGHETQNDVSERWLAHNATTATVAQP